MKRYIGLIVLAVVFAALLVIVLITAPQAAAPTTGIVPATPTLSAEQQKLIIINLPTTEQPSKLVLTQANPAKTISLVYEGAAWKLESQPQTPLDSSVTAGTIGLLTNYRGTQVVSENPTEANLKEYGLDNPPLKIELTSPSGTRILSVGISNTVTNVFYLKLADKPTVWAVAPSLITTLKGWVDQPPLAPPTPTPIPTLPITPTLNPSAAATATANATLTPATSPAAGQTPGTSPTVSATVATTPTVAATTAPTVGVTPTTTP